MCTFRWVRERFAGLQFKQLNIYYHLFGNIDFDNNAGLVICRVKNLYLWVLKINVGSREAGGREFNTYTCMSPKFEE